MIVFILWTCILPDCRTWEPEDTFMTLAECKAELRRVSGGPNRAATDKKGRPVLMSSKCLPAGTKP